MSNDMSGLGDLSTLSQVLTRTPSGAGLVSLAEHLGLITEGTVGTTRVRRAFKANISRLSENELSDEQGWWAAEMGRLVEMVGVLQGQEKMLGLESKSARAKARARVRAKAKEEGTKPTATQINDDAEEDPIVIGTDEKAQLVILLLASAQAAKEATGIYLASLSREISFRCSRMQAGIY